MQYGYCCECDANKHPLIERVVGSVCSYEDSMFKALLCKDYIRENEKVMKAEDGSY